jgi:hypothetical protein
VTNSATFRLCPFYSIFKDRCPKISRDKKYLRFSLKIEDTFGLQLVFRGKKYPNDTLNFSFVNENFKTNLSLKICFGVTEGGDSRVAKLAGPGSLP